MSKKNIILIKKVQTHGRHHGGAWKVAYADFVTAMMALFIVLWLMNTSDHVRKVIAGYFNDPRGRSEMTGTDRSGTADNLPALTRDNIKQLKERIEHSIQPMVNLKALSNQVEITVTPEGLRIELLETKNGTFFETGSATLNDNGRELLTLIAQQLKDIPNHLAIEGHTDSQPYADSSGYGNWELSADRANAARRVMQGTGLRPDQISQVRGYADQKLRLPQNPMDPSNRRISLIVQYMDAAPAEKNAGKQKPDAAEATVSIPAPSAGPQAVLKPATPKPAVPTAQAVAPKPDAASAGSRIARQLLARLHGR